MGSSICVNCTTKTEESDMQPLPQAQQIMFEYTELQEIPETSKPKDQQQQQQQQTDTSEDISSSELRGILKHNLQHTRDLGNAIQDNRSSTAILKQRKKVKFRRSSKSIQSD
ncbi:unnamed protein product [Paramecium octaurelia]|uniref:Uncharacterized protein n=1 Tax=Paramecium octaurelia TaxID=43137 RepID=A0A8S1U4J7_PAROT|nr:unnamed protein product [Paramecium octaurelia]